MWISHVTCEWVMSYVNESCHMWMSHVTCEWVMSHVNESCHMWMSTSRHNESCHIYEWVMSHVNESSWRTSQGHRETKQRREQNIGQPRHVTYVWAMSNIWMSHVTHMNESCHTYEWVITHLQRTKQDQAKRARCPAVVAGNRSPKTTPDSGTTWLVHLWRVVQGGEDW